MSKTLTLFAAALVMGAGLANDAFAQSASVSKDAAAQQGENSDGGQSASVDEKESAAAMDADGEKPTGAPGWIVVEEDFWFPFRFSFADAIHNAHEHYRHGREQAARDNVEKAMMWLKLAKGMTADKLSEENLDTAISDLRDLAMFIDRGDLVRAATMDKTFARAATALAKHHKFNADRAVAKNQLRLAGKHLATAAFNIKEASRVANHEYGSDVVEVFDNFFPDGSYDETVVVEPNAIQQALDAISAEITTLEKKVTKSSK